MKDSNQQQTTGKQLPLFAKKHKEMSVPERVQQLQHRLYLKAKSEKAYKFYVLYDKVFLPYIIQEAWNRVKAAGGSAGIDNITIGDIERQGVAEFLAELQESLRR